MSKPPLDSANIKLLCQMNVKIAKCSVPLPDSLPGDQERTPGRSAQL